MISVAQLVDATGCRPDDANLWAQPLADACNNPLWQINTPKRMAYFVANTAWESNKFTAVEEDLFYTTTKACMSSWPSKFTNAEQWRPYLRSPQKLANLVYANRGGNGSEQSGDGWTYRGRGPIQMTLHDNYLGYQLKSKNGVVADPDLVLDSQIGADAAAWFFWSRDCNRLADSDRIVAIANAINPGEDKTRRAGRLDLCQRSLQAFTR